MAEGVFATHDTPFATLAWTEARQAGDQAFWPRNFLLDGNVTVARATSYLESASPADRSAWEDLHENYFVQHLERIAPGGPPATSGHLAALNTPETFLNMPGDGPFTGTGGNLHLIRLERADLIGPRIGLDSDVVTTALKELPGRGNRSPSDETWLQGILTDWAETLAVRPVFAGFVADVEDVLSSGAPPDEMLLTLRDRFGLAYLVPEVGGRPLDVAVFTYPVDDLPVLSTRPTLRPVMPPSVLDGRPYEAFLPSPRATAWGNAVALRDDGRWPVREVVHPSFRYDQEHLLFTAAIDDSPAESLLESRKRHICRLRTMSGLPHFAMDTDGVCA